MTDLNEYLFNNVLSDFEQASIHVKDWNPRENIEQAIMCLEHFDTYHINAFSTGNISVQVTKGKDRWRREAKTLPLAISLACARAKGWKDD